MFIYFDNPQAPVIVLVQDSFDTRRFAGPCISKKQTVVGFLSADESFCIVNQLFLGDLIPHEIRQLYVRDIRDRDDLHILFRVIDPESLVKAKLSDPGNLCKS